LKFWKFYPETFILQRNYFLWKISRTKISLDRIQFWQHKFPTSKIGKIKLWALQLYIVAQGEYHYFILTIQYRVNTEYQFIVRKRKLYIYIFWIIRSLIKMPIQFLFQSKFLHSSIERLVFFFLIFFTNVIQLENFNFWFFNF